MLSNRLVISVGPPVLIASHQSPYTPALLKMSCSAHTLQVQACSGVILSSDPAKLTLPLLPDGRLQVYMSCVSVLSRQILMPLESTCKSRRLI